MLGVECFEIDVSKDANFEAVQLYLRKRNPGLSVDEIRSHSFILANKFNDVWVNGKEITKDFQPNSQFYFKFFMGPRPLKSADHLVVTSGGQPDFSFVTYLGDPSSENDLSKTK